MVCNTCTVTDCGLCGSSGGDPVCGDSACEGSEDCSTCPADCPSFSVGGANPNNNVCEAGDGETCYNTSDCNGKTGGKPSGRFCCGFDANESPAYSPDGCGSGSQCNASGHTCTTVPVGGGSTTCCGDGVCETPEDSGNCEIDCGAAGFCGDNNIDPGETCDGTDLGGATCSSQGCTGGTLACAVGSCSAFDTSGCTGCQQCVDPGLGQPCTASTNCCSGIGNCTGGKPSNRVCL